MPKWKIYTPEGVQDILFKECNLKRKLEHKFRNLFKSYGYKEIETPTIEFYDVFASDEGTVPQENMFKFFDQQGRILVLRPDITVPVARVTATKYKDAAYPLRISYIGNVFRYNDFGGGKQNEFTQAGIEVLGVSTPDSDAEVISVAIKALKESGLESFKIDIGQVEFFNGLMEEARLPEEAAAQINMLIGRKDNAGLVDFLSGFDIDEGLKKLIIELPGLFGPADILDMVQSINLNNRSKGALENIRKVYDILKDYGHSEYVSIDLGMLRGLDYDTGIIFRGFAYGVGFPILTGGRYDRLVGEFGKDCPATGFSLGVNLIMMALQKQEDAQVAEKPCTDSFVCYSANGRKTAIELCEVLRGQGLSIELDITDSSPEEALGYAKAKGIGGTIRVIDEENVEIHYVQSGEVAEVRISELLKR